MPDRLVILGAGTCRLVPGQATSSVLVERSGLRIVFDFGRGVATRLAELGLRQDDVRHVVLSHFHPDHLTDLLPYLQAGSWSPDDPRSEDLHVWGPSGLESQLTRLLALFGPDVLVRQERFRVHLHEIRGDGLEIEGRSFDFLDLPPAGNRGLRWAAGAQTLALTGDSHFHDQEVAFLQGIDLGIFDSGHLDDDEIVDLAVRSSARRLLASHLYRELDVTRLQEKARRRGWQGTLEMARELQVIELPV